MKCNQQVFAETSFCCAMVDLASPGDKDLGLIWHLSSVLRDAFGGLQPVSIKYGLLGAAEMSFICLLIRSDLHCSLAVEIAVTVASPGTQSPS